MLPRQKNSHQGFSLRHFLFIVSVFSVGIACLVQAAASGWVIAGIAGMVCLLFVITMGLVLLWRAGWQYLLGTCVALACLYGGTYYGMSTHGEYKPLVYGAGHVKMYAWVPYGFPSDGSEQDVSSTLITWVFYPPLCFDRVLWHEHAKPNYKGPYPIDRP